MLTKIVGRIRESVFERQGRDPIKRRTLQDVYSLSCMFGVTLTATLKLIIGSAAVLCRINYLEYPTDVFI